MNIFDNTKKELVKDKNSMTKLLLVDGIFTSVVFKRAFNLATLSFKFDFIELFCGISSMAVFIILVGLYSATNTKLTIVDKLNETENIVDKNLS